MFHGLYDNSNAYWPGRRRPGVWKEYGKAFSELNTTTNSTQRRQHSDPSARPDRAGKESHAAPRGSVSFLYQTEMRLGMPETCGTTLGRSEARARFQGPGKDYVPRGLLRTDKSNFPKETYPNDFKTTKQLEYDPSNKKQPIHGKFPAYSFKDSGKVYTKEWESDFKSTNKTLMQTMDGPTMRQASHAPKRAGKAATQRMPFNIITGSDVMLGNNPFEHYESRDYRRHRI